MPSPSPVADRRPRADRRSSARRPATLRSAAAVAGLALTAATLAACSGSADDPGTDAAGGTPSIVASTNVYGDIARAVAGDHARVDSVISDPAADPHSFESTPADAARITSASLVVYNGAGYDEFVDQALATRSSVPTVKAVDEFRTATGVTVTTHEHAGHEHSGHEHEHGADGGGEHHDHDHAEHEGDEHEHEGGRTTDNEHVWYSLPTAAGVARAIARQLVTIDPDDSAAYTANAEAFAHRLEPLTARLDELRAHPTGGHAASYVQTEPIAHHLFDAAGLTDSTPPGFTSAVESDSDPSAADLDATSTLLSGKKVRFLALNTQTETTLTGRLRDTAAGAGLPVVEVTETLPADTDYVGWMTANVEHTVAAATRPAA